MNVKKCKKGHYYDADMYSSCPQCSSDTSFGAGVTEPAEQAGGYGATEPINGFSSEGMGETQDVTDGYELGFNGGAPEVEDYDSVTQAVDLGGIAGFAPVTGWLICIDGPERGKDYRIKPGCNYIGRSEHMDICLRGDNKISRDRHAMIAYDDLEKVFYFGPILGASIVRINGKMIMTQTVINAYDIITIGSTKLIFIPLCCERFDWSQM